MPPTQKWQVVAGVGEFGDFDEVTGGNVEGTQTDYTPGGQNFPIKLQGTASTSDITVKRAYVPERDGPVIDWAKNWILYSKGTPRTLVKKYLNAQKTVVKTDNYPRCLPKSYVVAEGKSGDNTVAEFSIVLGVETVG